MNTSTSPKTESAPRLRPAPLDAAVVLAILALAVLLFWALLPKGGNDDVLICTVSQNGEVLDTISLDVGMPEQDRTYGEYVVTFNYGHIRLRSAPCANQDCVHTGWIHRSGQSIVCLPGRFIVELSAGYPTDPGFDIVVK